MFIGLLIFISLIIIRPQDFVPGLKGSRLVLLVMGTLMVTWFFSSLDKRVIRTSQDRYVVMFQGTIVLSTLTLFWVPWMIEVTVETAKLLLIYTFLVSIIDSEDRFRKVTWTLVILMAVVATMGILQYFGMDITGAKMIYAADKGVWQIRGIGNFDNPNDLAYSVVFIVPFALGYLISARNNLYRIGAMLLLYLAIYCIYLTRSRGGLVALGSCLISWGYFWITSEKLKRYVRIAAVLGILGVFAIQSGGYRDDASAMGRIEAWSAGWSMLKSHPIIGVGKDQFTEFHARDSHNSYVRAGAELGFFWVVRLCGDPVFFHRQPFLWQAHPGRGQVAVVYGGIRQFSHLFHRGVGFFHTDLRHCIFVRGGPERGHVPPFHAGKPGAGPKPPFPHHLGGVEPQCVYLHPCRAGRLVSLFAAGVVIRNGDHILSIF